MGDLAQAVKVCTKCATPKASNEYARDASKKDGLYSSCKACTTRTLGSSILDASRQWKKRNREHIKEYKRSLYVAHPRPPKDPTAPKRAKKAWKRRNPSRVIADRARRRAKECRATPTWANEFFMREAYELARRRSKIFGFKWHVDHVVPLRSSMVCGLHVHFNLRVISGRENQRKGNRLWPNMP
jgi:hypothetical protein